MRHRDCHQDQIHGWNFAAGTLGVVPARLVLPGDVEVSALVLANVLLLAAGGESNDGVLQGFGELEAHGA